MMGTGQPATPSLHPTTWRCCTSFSTCMQHLASDLLGLLCYLEPDIHTPGCQAAGAGTRWPPALTRSVRSYSCKALSVEATSRSAKFQNSIKDTNLVMLHTPSHHSLTVRSPTPSRGELEIQTAFSSADTWSTADDASQITPFSLSPPPGHPTSSTCVTKVNSVKLPPDN
jgi:hypothetical protein